MLLSFKGVYRKDLRTRNHYKIFSINIACAIYGDCKFLCSLNAPRSLKTTVTYPIYRSIEGVANSYGLLIRFLFLVISRND